jgi:hypothetical protein
MAAGALAGKVVPPVKGAIDHAAMLGGAGVGAIAKQVDDMKAAIAARTAMGRAGGDVADPLKGANVSTAVAEALRTQPEAIFDDMVKLYPEPFKGLTKAKMERMRKAFTDGAPGGERDQLLAAIAAGASLKSLKLGSAAAKARKAPDIT